LVVGRGHQARDDQLPHAQAGEGRTLRRAHLRSHQGLGVLLRQVQADSVQGHHLRQVRRRGHSLQGPPRAHGPHPAGQPGQPHLVFQGHAEPPGILLDISPRNLERILYFALYIVTHVDEDARKRALAALEDEAEGRGGKGGRALSRWRTSSRAASTARRTS
jgi:hypothetical protein